MNPDGSGVTRLTTNSGPDIEPAWSPDGTKIVFARFITIVGQENRDIFVINADGSGLRGSPAIVITTCNRRGSRFPVKALRLIR